MKNIIQKLFKSAEGYKNTDNIEELLLKEAIANGLSVNDAQDTVYEVLEKLRKTEQKTEKGDKFGVAHDPNKQYLNLIEKIKSMRF